jgi:EAL domain-containing protein (putative c-di-GMP-specific phosphodiesterase class I)
LLRSFEQAFVVGSRDLQQSFSAGGALASESTQPVDGLLQQATAAMRAAKTAGGGRFSFFDASMDERAEEGLALDLSLRRALKSDQFFLLYQPIVESRGGEVHAVEALLRWASPDRGFVSPGEFIGVLEETGLIVPVGHWVLREACARAAAWHREGHRELVLSVNMSPRQFQEPDLVERVRGTLLATGFPAESLQLEVTEGLLLEPGPELMGRINELAALGLRMAVDDFGMGYSSLAYLKRFPLHTLKIDRMFVRDICDREQDGIITRAIVDLGHGLGLRVTAEGVETQAQADALRDMGCDSLQGYLFARPMTADALTTHTTSSTARDST